MTDSDGDDSSRDYEDVEEAARELGGRPPDGLPGGQAAVVHPIEESEDVAAAVDDEAPVPELAETEPPPDGSDGDPSTSRSTRSG